MGTDAIEAALKQVLEGWNGLGMIAKSQSGPVMKPILALLGALSMEVRQLQLQVDGLKALNCSGGECSTCAGPGPDKPEERALHMARFVTQVGGRVPTLSAGVVERCMGPGFPPIEG